MSVVIDLREVINAAIWNKEYGDYETIEAKCIALAALREAFPTMNEDKKIARSPLMLCLLVDVIIAQQQDGAASAAEKTYQVFVKLIPHFLANERSQTLVNHLCTSIEDMFHHIGR